MQKLKKFWKQSWEAKPDVFRGADTARAAGMHGILSFEAFCDLLDAQEEEGQCLKFDQDVHAMFYNDGERLDWGPELQEGHQPGDEALDRALAENLFGQGLTFQVRSAASLHAGQALRRCSACRRGTGHHDAVVRMQMQLLWSQCERCKESCAAGLLGLHKVRQNIHTAAVLTSSAGCRCTSHSALTTRHGRCAPHWRRSWRA